MQSTSFLRHCKVSVSQPSTDLVFQIFSPLLLILPFMFWSYFSTVYERTTLYLCCWNFTTNPAILRMLAQLHMFYQRYIRASQRDSIHMMFIRNSYSVFLRINWFSQSRLSPVNCLSSSLRFLFSIIGVCVSGVNHILQT